MAIVCGKCSNHISDVGTCNEAKMIPDPDPYMDGKAFQVFECGEGGSLTILWRVWPDGEEKSVTYIPSDGKCHDLTKMQMDEFYHET